MNVCHNRAGREKRRHDGDKLRGWPDGLGRFGGWERAGDGMGVR